MMGEAEAKACDDDATKQTVQAVQHARQEKIVLHCERRQHPASLPAPKAICQPAQANNLQKAELLNPMAE